MTTESRFERDLPEILEGLYLSRTPDYRTDVLAIAIRTRQRPAWTFPGRWIPMADIASRPALAPRLPWRMIGLAILVIALLAAGAVLLVGSRTIKVPPPFGPARNGLIAYSANGDIFAADPVTGATKAIVGGAAKDSLPRFSNDGTKLAFLRFAPDSVTYSIVVAAADGSGATVLSGATLQPNDEWEWAPDGASLFVQSTADNRILRVDASGAAAPVVVAENAIATGNIRPPASSQVLYEPQGLAYNGLWVVNADGSRPTELIGKDNGIVGTDNPILAHYSPDGTRIALAARPAGDPGSSRIFVMNADGTGLRQVTAEPGAWFEYDLVWSPDGRQIAFNRWFQAAGSSEAAIEPIGVVAVDGDGSVRGVGPAPVSDGAAFDWSPDGTKFLSMPAGTLEQTMSAWPIAIDVATGASSEIGFAVSSETSWQRTAP